MSGGILPFNSGWNRVDLIPRPFMLVCIQERGFFDAKIFFTEVFKMIKVELKDGFIKEFEKNTLSLGLHNKLYRMPNDAREKLKQTIERIINEGCSGLICIIL